jgi:hypothetical protein
MTTKQSLRKLAQSSGFTIDMLKLGFSIGPSGLWFYRLRDDYIDFFEFWIKSSGNFATVPVTCLKIDLIDHCNMKEFPKGFTQGIPIWGDAFINDEYGIEIGGDPWSIKSEDDVLKTFKGITFLFYTGVNEYFTNIDSDRKLYESLSVRAKETQDGSKIKLKLLGCDA